MIRLCWIFKGELRSFLFCKEEVVPSEYLGVSATGQVLQLKIFFTSPPTNQGENSKKNSHFLVLWWNWDLLFAVRRQGEPCKWVCRLPGSPRRLVLLGICTKILYQQQLLVLPDLPKCLRTTDLRKIFIPALEIVFHYAYLRKGQ